MSRSHLVYSKATPRQKLSPAEKQRQAERENLEAAVLILSAAHGQFDENSLAVRWARAFIARIPEAAAHYDDRGQLGLFTNSREPQQSKVDRAPVCSEVRS